MDIDEIVESGWGFLVLFAILVAIVTVIGWFL